MSTTSLLAAASSSSAAGFLGVDWSSIAEVCVVTLVATVAIVTIFSVGLRLLSIGSPDDGGEIAGHGALTSWPASATLGGYVCVGIGGAAVLYGIYLVVPLFH
ncbi:MULTISPECIES: hypothetical protein [unclassified Frondihabitans]|uniref:hypothetical protein n=1 Tax=unclassified Frondihabitans TaxID=2626248 RepID=UPI000F4FF94C|nr:MULTISPECIES: hypothetical protein [unclassified Frondihabitans]RPE78390.1 hypothetical protein EDF37_1066 [Frondihabitans sp. PhB153]RPF08671.1 hypothetical protein EDF39_1068 [Frondihabitans sp. PhB161]